MNSSRYWPPNLGNLGQKTSLAKSEKCDKNTFEEGPMNKKLKTCNDNFLIEPKHSNNRIVVNEKRQKTEDNFYRGMYSNFHQESNISSNQYQILSNNPVFNSRNLTQFSKSSPQKPTGNFFLILNLINFV